MDNYIFNREIAMCKSNFQKFGKKKSDLTKTFLWHFLRDEQGKYKNVLKDVLKISTKTKYCVIAK